MDHATKIIFDYIMSNKAARDYWLRAACSLSLEDFGLEVRGVFEAMVDDMADAFEDQGNCLGTQLLRCSFEQVDWMKVVSYLRAVSEQGQGVVK